MTETSFTLNGQDVSVRVLLQSPTFHALRGPLGHAATRFGRGVGLCGADCAIIIGEAGLSCDTPVSAIEDAAANTAGKPT